MRTFSIPMNSETKLLNREKVRHKYIGDKALTISLLSEGPSLLVI